MGVALNLRGSALVLMGFAPIPRGFAIFPGRFIPPTRKFLPGAASFAESLFAYCVIPAVAFQGFMSWHAASVASLAGAS